VLQKRTQQCERIRRVEERLQASLPPAVRKRVEIVRMAQPNAFVAPGRYIYITSDLMNRLSTDDAVALVIGHELAHAELGHLFEFRRRALWKEVPVGDLAYIIFYLVQRFVSSPENERDADAYGLDLALAAGYDGDKCLEAHEVLEKYMMSIRGGEIFVAGPEAAGRQTDDPFEAWKAQAEVWLWERMTGYPAVRERRIALSDRLAQHRAAGRAPLLLPGSRKSTADVNAGFRARVQAIDAEMEVLGTELTALATDLASLLRNPTYRSLAASIQGEIAGLSGRTAREAEAALCRITEMTAQTSALMDLRSRAQEIRRFLNYDYPPQSAMGELQSVLFGLPMESDTAHSAGSSTWSGTSGGDARTAPTPRSLIKTLTRELEAGAKLVDKVEACRAQWGRKICAYREDLETVQQACLAVAPDRTDLTTTVADRLDALERRVHSDPLDISPGCDAGLRNAIAEARREMLARVVKARSGA